MYKNRQGQRTLIQPAEKAWHDICKRFKHDYSLSNVSSAFARSEQIFYKEQETGECNKTHE